jgi:hypothetical protein
LEEYDYDYSHAEELIQKHTPLAHEAGYNKTHDHLTT